MESQSQDDELKAHLLSTSPEYRKLVDQHAELKQQIGKIEARVHLTEDDELEEQRLKKLKLHIKDQLNEMIDQYKQAGVR